MDPVVNTVTVSTKKLFQYDKIRKEEGKDWDEVNWEEDMEDGKCIISSLVVGVVAHMYELCAVLQVLKMIKVVSLMNFRIF